MQKNDWERAGLYFKRAADSATKDPQVHYLLALWMSRKSGALGGAPEELEAMKKELTAAVTLDPDYADAYSLLGMTLSNAGDTASAGDALKKAMALNPRNEWYAFNLANVYLRSQDFDQALPLLKQLQLSSDQQIARMAAMQLAQAETYARYSAHRDQEPRTEAAPQDEEESNPRLVELEKPAAPVATAPISFLKGTLVSVDCAQAPAAVLTIASGGKQWKMLAPQAKKLVVMGADELSCSWSNKRVAVNFRKTGEAQGQLVSLELQ